MIIMIDERKAVKLIDCISFQKFINFSNISNQNTSSKKGVKSSIQKIDFDLNIFIFSIYTM